MTEQLARYIQDINKRLDQYLTTDEPVDGIQRVYDSMRYSVLGTGKRIRPVMTLGFCALSGGDDTLALPFACAVEMIHAYSLIHDDLPCMDNDTIRRGKPTNHMVYGEAIALLAGDGLLTKAFEVTANAEGIELEGIAKAVSLLARMAGADGMVGGQCIDLELDQKDARLDILQQMDMGKTVSLISAACQLGCIAAKADAALLSSADLYAQGMGMAFQIRDDVLGAVGDTSVLGKSVGLDAENGKQNYVTLLGVEHAQQLVKKYTKTALLELEKFPGNTDFLKALTLSLVDRNV